jgi:hypothetical protein
VLDLIDRRAIRLFAVLAAVAFATLLYLGRHGSFYHDEWTFIGKSGGTLSDWFGPHNEHWSTVPFLIHRVLLLTVGLTSYLPYLAVLLALHVAAAASLFVLVRRMSGTLVALAASAIFLFLGSGADDLFWAFQIGFVSSAAGGLGALAALSDDRPRTASVLLLVAIASSSTGLPFVAAAVVMLLVDPARRRQLAWLMPVVAVFLVWFVLIGRSGVAGHDANLSPEALALLPEFTAFGVADSIDAAFGLARPLGALLGALVIGWALVQARARARARSLDVRAVAAAVGLVVLFVLIGLGRGQFGVEQASRSRYLYFGVAFVLLGCAAVLGGRAEVVARRIGSRQRVTAVGAVTGALVMLLAGNGLLVNARLLPASAEFFAQAAGELRAFIALADRYGSVLPYRPPPITRIYIPAPAILRELFGVYGSPTSDALVPSVVRPPSPTERDRALWDLTGGLLAPHGVAPPTVAAGPPPTVEASGHARLSIDAGCLLVRSTAGSAGTVTLRVPEASFVLVMVAEGGDGTVRLGRDAPPDAFDQLGVSFPAGRWLRFDPPRLGDGSMFGVQLVLPAGSTARICGPSA